jgi:acid phosphatase class B
MKMVFMDIDDTLLFTSAKIIVNKDGKMQKRLTNKEFNNYDLKLGESFDFSEFEDSRLFAQTSVPNYPMVNLLKDMHRNGDEVLLLTARGNFDCKETIATYFNDLGIPVGHYLDSKIHIARCGRDKYSAYGKSNTRKKHVIQKILAKRSDVTYIEMYDDSMENLKTFKTIDFPSSAFLVDHSIIMKI